MPETIGEAFVAIRADDSKFKSDVASLGELLDKVEKKADIRIRADEKGFKSDVDGLGRTLDGVAKKGDIPIKADTTKAKADVDSLNKRVDDLKKTIGNAAIGVGIGAFFKSAIGEAEEAQKVSAQTAAVIKSTGGAANVSAQQIDDLSASLSKKIGVDDEAIQSGANLLLTFTNIKNEAGAGNDIFNQSTTVLADLAAAMGTDMSSAAVQLGKALNDPVAGISALTRVGVTFTAQQKEQIKALVESGDVMGAQKIILAELTKEFGGSAEAQATGLDKAKVAWQNFEETIGTDLAPVVQTATTLLSGLLSTLDEVGLSSVATGAAMGALLGARVGGGTGALLGAIGGLALGLESLDGPTITAKESTTKLITELSRLGTTAAAAKFQEETRSLDAYAKVTGEATGRLKVFQEIARADPGLAQQIIDGLKRRHVATADLEAALRKVIKAEEEHAAAAKRAATDTTALGSSFDSTGQLTEEAGKKLEAFLTTVNKEKQAVDDLQNALLAAQGGVLGYQAAVNSSEDAQLAYNAAVGLFGPESEEAQRAQLAVEQAQLQVASAAESVIKSQGDLNEMLNSPTPAALETARQKLVDFQAQYGDTTGAVQAQIDRTDEAIRKWHELHDVPDITKAVEFVAAAQTAQAEADFAAALERIKQHAIEVAFGTPGLATLFGLPGGPPVPDLGPGWADFIAGRAMGGPVGAGTWLVGEKGPEVLTLGAGQSGYVTPNSALSAGGDTYNFSFAAGPPDPVAWSIATAKRLRVEMSAAGR